MDYSVKLPTGMSSIRPSPPHLSEAWSPLLIGCLLALALICLPTGSCRAAAIVIDPGHGGNDGGVAPKSDHAEKYFTLALAQRIAAELTPAHQVNLTRTSDIGLSPADRAGIANHRQADLMVSIHAAAPPLCSPKQIALYVHADERLSYPAGTSVQEKSLPERSWEPWRRLQMRHRHQSRLIAEAIRQALEHSPPFESVLVFDAPLVALMGADMPALLMELSCIHPNTGPAPEIREQRLADYASAIAHAIDAAVKELER